MTKLSPRELSILGCIEHRPNATGQSLTKQLRMKAPTIRYHVARLVERGIIVGKVPFINLSRLGYVEHVLFFSLGAISASKKSRLLEMLIRSRGTTWLATLGGEYQIAISVAAQSIGEIQELFFKIAEVHTNLFRQKAVSIRLGFSAFGRKYLAGSGVGTPEFQMRFDTGDTVEVDSIDRRILGALCSGKCRSQRETAQVTGIPMATVDRRIKKLEEEKVIGGYLYRLNLADLPISTYRILIQSKGITKSLRDRLYQHAKEHPHILHFIECFGVWDFEFNVEVRSPEDINPIIDDIHFQFGEEIEKIMTLQIFRHMKYSGFPFENSA